MVGVCIGNSYILRLGVMQMKIRHKAKFCMGHFDQQLNRLAENVRLILLFYHIFFESTKEHISAPK